MSIIQTLRKQTLNKTQNSTDARNYIKIFFSLKEVSLVKRQFKESEKTIYKLAEGNHNT